MKRSILYKLLFLALLPLNIWAVEDIDSLLNHYEEESALNLKTKRDSSGHNIVYTRDELDKMQAHTLKDVIKSIRQLTMMDNSFGATELQRAGAYCTNSACVRLYVNDQEMTSGFFGGALGIFSEYDLGHIDHIQIYLGGNAIEFGNEYGFITIKMYTKDPDREKGSSVGLSYGTNDSYRVNALTTGKLDNDINYLLYASKLKNNKDTLGHKGYDVPRYSDNLNLFATFKRENDFIFELSRYEHKHDGLTGFGDQKTPTRSDRKSMYQYLSLTKYFDTVKLQISYAEEEVGITNNDYNGITLYDGSFTTEYDNRFENKIFRVNAKDSRTFGKHRFFYGVEYQHKGIKPNFNIDGVDRSSEFEGPDSIDLYSVFLEYQYQFSEDTVLLATGKLERYDQHYNDRTDNLTQSRIGIVSQLNENLLFKGFISQNYIYPSLEQLSTAPRPVKGNVNLIPTNIDTVSAEFTYKTEQYQVGLGYLKMYTIDPIKVNANKMYFNKKIEAIFDDYFVNCTYNFNKDNKVIVEYYWTNHNRPFSQSPSAGGHIKLFNTYDDFDFYTEFIYREGFVHKVFAMEIDDGYDLTAAITYHMNSTTTVSLKGQNLLDKAILAPIRGLYPIGTLDKKVMLNVEWFF
ncbi:MAG: hypothetical protein DRG09_04085 [Epsilonproteobacteria bacterium]|nr:MAG: hypothetical protein DRG09_04085 [Campylobacterota bacterium]